MMVAACRRVRQPSCKFDEMLVLESPQGELKSTALAVLADEPDWFSDDLPLNADTKVVIEQLQGHWIVGGGAQGHAPRRRRTPEVVPVAAD